MPICLEHVYQLDKDKTTMSALREKIDIYRSMGRCYCCVKPLTEDHAKCCQFKSTDPISNNPLVYNEVVPSGTAKWYYYQPGKW